MPEYYFEYAVPDQDEYDPSKALDERTDPDAYTVTFEGVVYAQQPNIASRQIRQVVLDARPQYEHGHGVVLFAELPAEADEHTFSFDEDDWRERLDRVAPSPEDTIVLDFDE